MKQQRRHFRLDFAVPERPKIVIANYPHEVIDLSEQGVKYKITATQRPQATGTVKGRLVFRNGTSVEVEGSLIRIDETQQTAAIQLTKGIPLQTMMEQHRLLIQNYKKK